MPTTLTEGLSLPLPHTPTEEAVSATSSARPRRVSTRRRVLHRLWLCNSVPLTTFCHGTICQPKFSSPTLKIGNRFSRPSILSMLLLYFSGGMHMVSSSHLLVGTRLELKSAVGPRPVQSPHTAGAKYIRNRSTDLRFAFLGYL